MKDSLWVVMPVYNEATCIEKVITEWLQELKKYNVNLTFCVLNDGSKDNTLQILKNLERRANFLRIVDKPNSGHGATCVYGYNLATRNNADYIFQVDSDDQLFPADFINLWNEKEASAFILGYRKIRHDAPFRLFISDILLRGSLLFLFGVDIKDSNIPFRLVKGEFMKKMLIKLPNPPPFAPNIFLSVMAKKSGQTLFNIPVKHKARETGTVSMSKMKLLKVGVKSFYELMNFRKELKKIKKDTIF